MATDLAQNLNSKKEKDIRVLRDFVCIYCRENHGQEAKEVFAGTAVGLPAECVSDAELCAECSKLLKHGIAKLLLCTQDPKPMCKKCTVHCYAPGYREKMREVMKFSGLYLIKHGRLDLIVHYAM